MKTKFEYVYFTKVYGVKNHATWLCHKAKDDTVFGLVQYDAASKLYCYFPYQDTSYPGLYLDDISNFITLLDLD